MTTQVLEDLALANHILVNQGVLDGFGHISVRHPQKPDRFFIARSMAPALVEVADIVEVDLEGNVHDAQGRRTYVERFIHSAIYKARPDVMSVIHSHSPAVIPFGVTGARLRPICHMSGFLGAVTPVFEIRHSAGETTEHLREDTVVVPDPADRATIEEEHALELRTRDRERKLLKKIEQSISRIDAGDYGYCDETGEAIGVGRLIARPTASLSLEAQQRRELKQKMFGD